MAGSTLNPLLIYCYDAYCGWCYGFSPVIKKIAASYHDRLSFEVISGGMILPHEPTPISATAAYISKSYKEIEALTGIKFGEDYLWHIFNPDKSDWFPHSEKPAVAMCIFKEYHPDEQVNFAADLQYALHFEGRDLTDNEAYRHLLDKYNIPHEDFYNKLKDEAYIRKAHDEFALVKQLKITGFPTVLLQANESKFYLVSRGYMDYERVNARIEQVLKEIGGDEMI